MMNLTSKRNVDSSRSATAIDVQTLSMQRTLANPSPRRAGRAGATTMATLERSVLQKINQYRQQQGLGTLTLNSTITRQARRHSLNMANTGVLSHNGFDGRVATIAKTIRYRGAAENVAFNGGFSDPVSQAVDGWLKSPGHLQNIVGNYNLTGIGVAKTSQGQFYFTQIFIRS